MARLTLRRFAAAMVAALAVAATAAPPDNCEEIRSAIERKIRASGAATITVTALEPGASTPGQVVGRCAQGTRLIVYRRELPSTAAAPVQAPSPPAATTPRAAPVITECRDGSAPLNGQCPKR